MVTAWSESEYIVKVVFLILGTASFLSLVPIFAKLFSEVSQGGGVNGCYIPLIPLPRNSCSKLI